MILIFKLFCDSARTPENSITEDIMEYNALLLRLRHIPVLHSIS